MRLMLIIAALLLPMMGICPPARAEALSVQAAKPLRPLARALMSAFAERHPKLRLDLAGGEREADVLLWLQGPGSAGAAPKGLSGAAQVIGGRQLGIWSGVRNVGHMRAANLLAPAFRRVAIADPATDPAGAAARRALMLAGVWGPLHGRLVIAADGEKAAELVRSGAVDAGIVEMTVILDPRNKGFGSHAALPGSGGGLAELRAGLSPAGAQKPPALDLISFLMSGAAGPVLARHGYGPR